MKSAIRFLLIFYSICTVIATKCFSSLGTDHKWNDNGTSVTCRTQAGVSTRYCLYFKTDGRPGKIFRDCDYVYENLFGFSIFNVKLGTGCRLFSGSTLDGGTEKGMYCFCLGDNCNGGDILYPVPLAPNTTTTAAPGG